MSSARLLQMSGVVIDLVYRVQTVPRAGEEAVSEESMIAPGGGFNAMVAASRAGMRVSYGGSHGTGRFADIVRSSLSEYGFPVLQSQLEHCDQGTCIVLVDSQGERTFVSQAGAERYFGSSQFAHIDASPFEFVLISGYTFALSRNPDILDDWLSGFPTTPALVFDPSPVVSQIAPDMLARLTERCAWISANADEARIMTGESDPRRAAELMAASMHETATGAVVRHGAQGCWLALRGCDAEFVPSYSVDTVDTNGAGDTHIGSFIAALATGATPVAAARFANAAAALSTEQNGPATAPDREQTLAFLASRKGTSSEHSDPWDQLETTSNI
ncbi:MAG: PfkB family carbohydrate kinase [Alphaproteobacteria bacterium]|nr:PfkB family carbohydrate kinase [Alphaproteobacteria bacterium]